MFKAPFSFEGRIRRSEFGISMIIYVIAITIVQIALISSIDSDYSNDNSSEIIVLLVVFIPLIWFLWAQGAKRCHDIGNSGWYQLIPFYVFVMLFADGEPGANRFGEDPKNRIGNNTFDFTAQQQQQQNARGNYSGGYDGGHNNPGTNYNNPGTNYNNNPQPHNPNQPNSGGEYKSGDMYK